VLFIQLGGIKHSRLEGVITSRGSADEVELDCGLDIRCLQTIQPLGPLLAGGHHVGGNIGEVVLEELVVVLHIMLAG
jgi:hypothetical protein